MRRIWQDRPPRLLGHIAGQMALITGEDWARPRCNRLLPRLSRGLNNLGFPEPVRLRAGHCDPGLRSNAHPTKCVA
jgi:hypothetical protein